MLARVWPLKVDLVGVRECIAVAVRGGPCEHESRPSGHAHAAEFGVRHDVSVMAAEWRVEAAGLLNERRDEAWFASQAVLEVATLGHDPDAGSRQARGRLATGADNQEEDGK